MLFAHLANAYGWTEEVMLNMSLSRLLLYYTASFSLPYAVEIKTTIGNKKSLWTVNTRTYKN